MGQEIFYEDEPLETPREGAMHQRQEDYFRTEEIDPTSLNIVESFGVFQGSTLGELRDDCFLPSSSKIESPWEKYRRIKMELEELKTSLSEADLRNDHRNKSIWSLLKNEADNLQGNIESISKHPGWDNMRESTSGDVKVLRELVNEICPNDHAEGKQRLSLCLERFITQSTSKRLAALESKVSSLQSALFLESHPSDLSGREISSSGPLPHQLKNLTQKINQIETINTDQLRAKIQSARKELESILSSGSEMQGESSRFSELYSKIYTFLEDFSSVESSLHDLPTLLLRLKTLEVMHRKAATFTNRVDQLEVDVRTILKDLQSNEVSVQELKDSLKENLLLLEAKLTK